MGNVCLDKRSKADEEGFYKGTVDAADADLQEYWKQLDYYLALQIDREEKIVNGFVYERSNRRGLDPFGTAVKNKRLRVVSERQRFYDLLNDRVRPIVEASFDKHDADGNGCLDHNESKLFFAHFVQEETLAMKALYKFQLSRNIDDASLNEKSTTESALSTYTADASRPREAKRGSLVDFSKVEGKIQAMLDEYNAHAEERTDAAFKVLATNSDGRLRKEDVVEGLRVGSEKFLKLNAALGFGGEELAPAEEPAEKDADASAGRPSGGVDRGESVHQLLFRPSQTSEKGGSRTQSFG